MTPPDWAVKFRRPGTELRRVNDALYKLYECSSVYDKEKKRARKITGKYLGSITEAGGFKESRKRIMEREIEELKSNKPAEVAEPRIGEVKDLSRSLVANCVSGLLPFALPVAHETGCGRFRR